MSNYVCIVFVCRFADTEVRNVAVSWIEKSSDDELADYLPQLVQVQLKISTQLHTLHALLKHSETHFTQSLTHSLIVSLVYAPTVFPSIILSHFALLSLPRH